jgi:hypothetical protein
VKSTWKLYTVASHVQAESRYPGTGHRSEEEAAMLQADQDLVSGNAILYGLCGAFGSFYS